MISNSSRYGIRAVVYIAGKTRNKENLGIRQISGDLDLPMPFLAKILQTLARQKILLSYKGPHGGFALARDASDILLIDVVEAIDGRDVFSRCILHNENCKSADFRKSPCALHGDYVVLRQKIKTLFTERSILDLVQKAAQFDDILL
jgi:Rrf2 family protein